ncbi:site-specific integrase [Limosilactobacillus kribbianus]|uniref:site-specific integrase n=1 Tax=Limosilactobacillus kribbianus TaxID=2982695 RepID=UPI0022649FB2|nr:site-specific integrase [Limosilactobacillus kribbianus]
MDYPYQKQFQHFLRDSQHLAPLTISTYDTSLTNFFAYLRANRPAFARDPRLANLTESDVRDYFNTLRTQQKITLSTYNKILSHLNRYFRYLFTHQLITTYPTLTLHGRAVDPNQRVNTKWLGKLDDILADDQLTYYTRMVLLVSKHGFTVGEFLRPGFARVFNQVELTSPAERSFYQRYQEFIHPLQARQNSTDLFLKQRYQPDNPRLTNAGLHKYLKQDEAYLGFHLAPKYLHQSYILTQLAAHQDWSDRQLMEALKLDPSSLLYYQRLLLQLK